MSVDFLPKNFPPFQVHHAKKPPRFYPDGFQRNVIDFYFIFSDCRLRKALYLQFSYFIWPLRTQPQELPGTGSLFFAAYLQIAAFSPCMAFACTCGISPDIGKAKRIISGLCSFCHWRMPARKSPFPLAKVFSLQFFLSNCVDSLKKSIYNKTKIAKGTKIMPLIENHRNI